MKLFERSFWENFILAAIVLVIIQTFLDEYSRYAHWSVDARNALLFAGLFFDSLFTAEFIVRSIFSSKGRGVKRYWIYERGWVDFLSSVPLLLLDSGPSVLLLLSGDLHAGGSAIGVLNVFKVVKAIRITRILRLIRIIKIFGKIHHAESKMAQHHTAAIATNAVFAIIMTLLVFFFVAGDMVAGTSAGRQGEILRNLAAVEDLHKSTGVSRKDIAMGIMSGDDRILRLTYRDETIISSVDDNTFERYYDREDYFTLEKDNFGVTVSLADIHREIAFYHIQNFFIIVVTVFSFMLLYSPHFVQTISDMIHILNKGLRKRDYNLQIKIPRQYEDHEIFTLARYYNDTYLPAKLKRLSLKNKKKDSGLSMKDLMDFSKK